MIKTLALILLFCASNASAFGWARAVRFSGGSTGGGCHISATGGTITDSGIYRIHTFTTNGNFVVSCGGDVEVLVVAGGGSGGGDRSSGAGGAGGYVEKAVHTVAAQSYAVVVGTGYVVSGYSVGTHGEQGGNSSFDSIVALGGGYGGAYDAVSCNTGGSGGGAANNNQTGCAATQGNSNGGTGYGYAGGSAGATYAAGGGGAGGVGTDGATNSFNAGGPGRANDITGTNITYSVGGDYDYNNVVGAACPENRGCGSGSGYCGLGSSCSKANNGVVIIRYIR